MIGEPNAVLERAHEQAPRRVEQRAGGRWSWLRVRRLSAMPVLAVGIVISILVVAIFADRVAPYDPLEGNYGVVRQPPSAQHLLGTDDIGRDVLSRLIYGARTSLLVGFGSVLVGDLIGLIWGVASGYI